MPLLKPGQSTRRLTAARFELTSGRGTRRTLWLATLAVAVAAVSLAAGLRLDRGDGLPGTRLAALSRENSRLRDELARARMDVQMERATRAELDRQVAELNDRVAHLTSQLEFFNAQSGRAAKPK